MPDSEVWSCGCDSKTTTKPSVELFQDSEKEILEQLKEEELFTLIVLKTYIYFKDFFKGLTTVDGLPTKKACVKRALENAKSHFLKTKEEVIECFTKDWDTYNLI